MVIDPMVFEDLFVFKTELRFYVTKGKMHGSYVTFFMVGSVYFRQ